MSEATILVVIDDLFFLSKVQTALGHLGLAARIVTDAAGLQTSLHDTAPALAVVDLTLQRGDAVSLIRALRATPQGRTVPILAFGAHVAVAMRQQALQAGADQVVAKSEFSRHLPDLIRQHLTVDEIGRQGEG
jgi:CheY-like chemotaxis protein